MSQTVLEEYQDILARAYVAMHPDLGSNDDEHELLYECVEILEDLVRMMGGELPPHPDDDEDDG